MIESYRETNIIYPYDTFRINIQFHWKMSTNYSKIQLVLYFSTSYHLSLWLDSTSMFISRHHRSLYSHSRYLKKYTTLHVTKNLPQYAYLDVSFHMMSLSSLENTTFYDFSLCQNWKERIYLLHWNWQSLSIGCRCLWTRLAYKCIVARDEKVSKR